MSGIARCIGVFDPWMKFGGDGGIVKTRYASYQKVVDRLRIITIRAKLTALDLYNLDYTKPVYIAQFGQIFAIYSVETGEDGICDCQLLKLKVDGVVPAHYYLYLDGQNADQSKTDITSAGTTITYSVQSNGTPYVVSKDSRLTVTLQTAEDGTMLLTIKVPQNTSDADIDYDPVILGVREDSTVRRQAAVSQKGKEYYLTLNGSAGDISINIEAAAKQNRVSWSSNGTPQILSYSGDAVALAEVDAYAVNIYSYANTTSEQRTGQVTVYLKEAPSIERKIVVIQEAAAAERMVIIDVHACGVAAGEGIELTFELISTCSGWYTVGDDLKVRVSFAQVSSELGQELADHVGERFYIEASNNGECWFGPVPASGNIEAELV